MISKRIFLPIFLLISTFFILNTYAAALQLTKIGSLDLGGHTYPEWWFTGTNPTLVGTASESAEVTLVIDENTYKATADGSGNWSYYAELGQGDYDIRISQGSESYSFKLHLGQALPANLGSASETSQSTTSVPSTGFNQISALAFGLGIMLLSTYLYVSGDLNKKISFEKRVLKED